MNIAILGYGAQGRSAYDYWRRDGGGNRLTVCDSNEALELPADVERQLGPDYLRGLERFDLIVRSPSVHPRDIAAANSPAVLDKVTTITNEFFKVSPTRHLVGVTGTKGKGTTSTLIARMLEADGRRVHLGGNIGTPPLDLLHGDIRADDWVVLELANFQLIDLRYSPPIAVCLMVVPEHLNWHEDMAEYTAAKSQLFAQQTPKDSAIYFAASDVSKQVASAGRGRKIPYYAPPGAVVKDGRIEIDGQTVCRTDELKLLGRHNWQNACAAVTAVWQVTQNIEAMRSVLSTFSGLEHRLELVRELRGVRYYDDSFGTTPETAIVAIEAFEAPEILILGGRGKGVPFDELTKTVAASANVEHVVAIGETGPEIAAGLRASGYRGDIVTGGQTMDEIVQQAAALARPGDVVLLSTANTSFDMFENYKQRGEIFKRAVQALA